MDKKPIAFDISDPVAEAFRYLDRTDSVVRRRLSGSVVLIVLVALAAKAVGMSTDAGIVTVLVAVALAWWPLRPRIG